jgi:hypothetical protein
MFITNATDVRRSNALMRSTAQLMIRSLNLQQGGLRDEMQGFRLPLNLQGKLRFVRGFRAWGRIAVEAISYFAP